MVSRFHLILFFFTVLTTCFAQNDEKIKKDELWEKANSLFQPILKEQQSDNNEFIIIDSILKIKLSKSEDSLDYPFGKRIGLLFLISGKHYIALDWLNYLISWIDLFHPKIYALQKIDLMITIGAAYEELGLWNQAISKYNEALTEINKGDFISQKARVYNNLAAIHYEKGNTETSRQYLLDAIEINEKDKNKRELSYNYNNLAAYYYDRKDYLNALEYGLKAMQNINKKNDLSFYYFMQANIGNLYANTKDYDISLGYLRNAFTNQKIAHYQADLVQTSYVIANVFEKIENNDSALFYYQYGLDIANSLNNNSLRENGYISLSKFLKKIGKIPEAYDNLLISQILKDSITQADAKIRMQNMDLIFRAEQKERERELLLKELSINNLRLKSQGYLFLTLFVLGVSLFLVLWIRSKSREKMRKNQEKIAEKEFALNLEQKRLAELKENELRQLLELRNRELTSKALFMVKNGEFMSSVIEDLKHILLEINPKETQKKDRLKEILTKLNHQGKTDNHEEFKFYFEQVYTSFYNHLLNKHPDLTQNDLRLCAFLRLGLSTKEIATITFRELRSVESARNRLRKKMNLDLETNIANYLGHF